MYGDQIFSSNPTFLYVTNFQILGNNSNRRTTINRTLENGWKQYDFNNVVNELSVNIPTTKTNPIPVYPQPHISRSIPGLERLSPDSPYTSPSHSPRPSPFCSPAQSPIAQRKMGNPKEIISETYATTSSWLKTLRLHKYSHILENYSFEKVNIMHCTLIFFIRHVHYI